MMRLFCTQVKTMMMLKSSRPIYHSMRTCRYPPFFSRIHQKILMKLLRKKVCVHSGGPYITIQDYEYIHCGNQYVTTRDIYSPKVLVIPRNRWLRLNMTEKLFTGTLNKNQKKKKKYVTTATVKFQNFLTPENFVVFYLKFKQTGQTVGHFVKKT